MPNPEPTDTLLAGTAVTGGTCPHLYPLSSGARQNCILQLRPSRPKVTAIELFGWNGLPDSWERIVAFNHKIRAANFASQFGLLARKLKA